MALEVFFEEVSLFFTEAFPSLFTPRCFSFCSAFIRIHNHSFLLGRSLVSSPEVSCSAVDKGTQAGIRITKILLLLQISCYYCSVYTTPLYMYARVLCTVFIQFSEDKTYSLAYRNVHQMVDLRSCSIFFFDALYFQYEPDFNKS